ncbi:hypothetical protein Vretifemale_20210 [Volvox reticuliferus]|uniref:Checkpoint protein n=1 Tax=Volvox reticuliferus TaxID=1737510 RepID=A0A8J4FZB9_9CHLO|nr:hypothetical protein Vretifemale_20210 [Volvox reticuliferus]
MQLVLRSINTAKSAFLSVTYFNRFFDSYEVYDAAVVQTIVLSKNAIAIFRSQKISQIEFTLDNAAARLRATVHTDEGMALAFASRAIVSDFFRNNLIGLIKRYAFDCLDGEVLQATVDRDAYPTVVIAEASELEKLLSSFQHTLDEITLIANPLSAAALANGHKACEMRSFVDPLKGSQESALLTSLTLDTRAVFTSYSHSSPLATDVTFNVKDFRAMTTLCTALGADVALRFEAAGAPLVVEPHFRGLLWVIHVTRRRVPRRTSKLCWFCPPSRNLSWDRTPWNSSRINSSGRKCRSSNCMLEEFLSNHLSFRLWR